MLPTEIGMQVNEVIKSNNKLSSFISDEKKIDFILKEISDSAPKAYKSTNSSRINKNNNQISNSEYAKLRNLNSYKQYIDKYINKYQQLGKINEQKAANIVKQYKDNA